MELFFATVVTQTLPNLRVKLYKGSGIEVTLFSVFGVLITLFSLLGISISSAVVIASVAMLKLSLVTVVALAVGWASYQYFFPISKRLGDKLAEGLKNEKEALLSISHLLCDERASKYSLTVSTERIDRAKGAALLLHAGAPVNNKEIITLGELLVLAGGRTYTESFNKTFCQNKCPDCS